MLLDKSAAFPDFMNSAVEARERGRERINSAESCSFPSGSGDIDSASQAVAVRVNTRWEFETDLIGLYEC